MRGIIRSNVQLLIYSNLTKLFEILKICLKKSFLKFFHNKVANKGRVILEEIAIAYRFFLVLSSFIVIVDKVD